LDLSKKTRDLRKSNRDRKREIAALQEASSVFSEENRSLREEIARLLSQQEEVYEDLNLQLAETKSARAGENAGLQRQQEKFEQELAKLAKLCKERAGAKGAHQWEMLYGRNCRTPEARRKVSAVRQSAHRVYRGTP
jgi:chromosome segregation ATPase